MDIYPSEDIYERSIPKETVEERLRKIWSRVGDHIRFGIGVVGEEAASNAINRPSAKRRPKAVPPSDSVSRGIQFSGPLPPPEALQRYENILPGAGDRIIRMAEIQQKHTHEEAMTAAKDVEAYMRRGQTCGVIVAPAAFATAAWLGHLGHSTTAAIVGGGAVVGLVSVFITGKRGPKGAPPD